MNDLLSRAFWGRKSAATPAETLLSIGDVGEPGEADALRSGGNVANKNLEAFLAQVSGIGAEMEASRRTLERIRGAHEEGKAVTRAAALKDLRRRMEREAQSVLRDVRNIKANLEALDRDNARSRLQPGCEAGSSTDRTRTATTAGLGSSLMKLMAEFQNLRQSIKAEYQDTIRRRYFTVTGEEADEATIERIVESGEAEGLLQKAIQMQGRGRVVDVVSEIQERHSAARDMERSLVELHQLFLDMAVLVQAQGEQLDDIEAHVGKASSFVHDGTVKLSQAKLRQRNSRKWTCIAIIILLVIILAVVLPLVLKKRKSKNHFLLLKVRVLA